MKQNKETNYIEGIDGLRAIAVIGVIIYHMDLTGLFKGGFTGVDVFFVISGYVISKSLYNHADKKFTEFIVDFYKRRILRILPLLIIVVTLTMLLTIMFIPSTWRNEMIQKTGLASLLGYANFALVWFNDGYFSPLVNFNPFLHMWSLAVEEQFYVIFPVFYFWWLKMKDRRDSKKNSGILLIACLVVASFGYSIYVTQYSPNQAYYLLPSRFWEIAIGVLLFQLHSKNILIIKSSVLAMWTNVLGLALIIIGFIYADASLFPYPWAIIPVAGTVLVICGVINPKLLKLDIRRILTLRLLVQIGKRSFSLYLWHWPIAVLLQWTLGFESLFAKSIYLCLSILLSIITYHIIENPIRSNSLVRSQKGWRIISTGILTLFLGYALTNWMIDNQSVLSLSVTKDYHTWYAFAFDEDGPKEPSINDPRVNGRRIFAIGDSHTAAYRTMLNIISKDLGVEIYEYEQGGCAVAGLIRPMNQIKGCEEFYRNALENVKKNSRHGDVVFLASLRMPELSNRFESVDVEEVLDEYYSKEAQANRELAYEEANEIIRELNEIGVHILIEAPKPVLLIPPYRCSDWFNRMNPIAEPGSSITRELLDQARQPVMDALERLSLEYEELYIWDPMDVLCPGEVFDAYDDGKPLFFDGDHLSAHGNRVLAPSFKERLLNIWIQNE